MMGFGSLGCGGPSSSSSNLSALAPPFTVDRFNSKPSSNPLVQFSELPYATPFTQTWQYSNPLAPGPDMYQKSGLEVDSTTITSVPLPNDYCFPYSMPQSDDPQTNTCWSTMNPIPKTASSATLLYNSNFDSYYTPYVSPVVNRDSPFVALSEPSYDMLPSPGLASAVSSQVDYTQNLHGLEYMQQLRGVWNGTLDGQRGKQADLAGGSFLDKAHAGSSSVYKNQMNHGFHPFECGEILVEEFGLVSDTIGRESSNGLVRMEHRDNMSHLAQIPFDSSRTAISTSSFTIPLSHPPGSSLHSPKSSANYRRPQNPFEKCIQTLDSSVSGSVSVTKSSPALVIRPPSSGSVIVPQNAAAGKILDAGNVAAFLFGEGLGKSNPSKGKELHILLDSQVEEGSSFTSQLKCQKEGNSQLLSVSSSVMEEVSSKPQSMSGLKVKFGSQVRNTDASDGLSLSGDSFLRSSDIGPDCLDHHNFAVDSPCWKGAPSSHFSPFDVMETDTTHQFGKKIDKIWKLDLQADQTFPSSIDPTRCSSEKAGEDKVHDCGHTGRGISAIPENASEADSTVREQRSVDAVKARLNGPILTNSKGVQFSEEFNELREDYGLPKHSKNDYESKSSGLKNSGVKEDNTTTSDLNFEAAVMDSVLNVSDTTEGTVAVFAAENVLCSPFSEEGASEEAKPYGGGSAPKMDVQALLKALCSISDLLLFNCFTNTCALNDKDLEVLQHVMRNLDKLASKKMVYFTQSQEPVLRRQDTCDKVADSLDPCMSNAAGKCQFESEAGRKSHNCLDYHSRHARMRNHNVNSEKPGIFQPSNPLRDDLDVLGDDIMAQAIRKVLEENFLCGEEMESQALLFKNLWLEAEAKLCSISYRARFDRMKMEMQKFKFNQAKENAAAFGNTSSSNSSHDLDVSEVPPSKVGNDTHKNLTIWSKPSFSSTSKVNDVETSVMTRFNILKCRNDSKSTNFVGEEADIVGCVSSGSFLSPQDQGKKKRRNLVVEPQCNVNQGHMDLHIGGSQHEPVKDGLSPTSNTDDVESSVMTRFHILKCRDDSKAINAVVGRAGKVDAVYAPAMPFLKGQAEYGRLNLVVEPHSHPAGDINQERIDVHVSGPGYESVKDVFLSMQDDPENQSSVTNASKNQHSLGLDDNCSSDWEHVLQDEVSWR